jgi:hypothetical protein
MTDWRTLATEDNQQRAAEAQSRLDDLGVHPDGTVTTYRVDRGYPPAMRASDKRFTDWYDRNVLGAAQDEYARRREEDEFRLHYPEPPDGSRFMWEDVDGTTHVAHRRDYDFLLDGPHWWVNGHVYTWRRLVVEFDLHMEDLTFLARIEGRAS